MKKPLKIMIVEDHAGYREVLAMAVESEDGMELLSQFVTAEVALRSLQNPSQKNSPDLVLLDLNLPGMSGLEALPWFQQYVPDSKIIVLTQSDQEADVLKAIAGKAAGYLLKSSTIDQILEGIRTVIDGGAALDPKMAKYILENMQPIPSKNAEAPTLTEREQEILSLLSKGIGKKEIAAQLYISKNTVAYHVKHIYEKLNVPNAPAAVAEAFKSGLL